MLHVSERGAEFSEIVALVVDVALRTDQYTLIVPLYQEVQILSCVGKQEAHFDVALGAELVYLESFKLACFKPLRSFSKDHLSCHCGRVW